MVRERGLTMMDALLNCLYWYDWSLVAYLLVANTIYFVLLLAGFFELLRHRYAYRGPESGGARELSPLVPPISLLVPAYNEQTTICDSVRAMLALHYPEFEVIVVNDGSKDDTLKILAAEFHLYRSARFYRTDLAGKPVRGVYESMDPIPLVVVDKENGGKADALNAAINAARYPLICTVDADSVLEEQAFLRVVYPFIDDPENQVLAVGGIVRAANGCEIDGGRITRVALPKSWPLRIRTVEYLRAFLLGRTGFSSFNCVLIISGAFALFSRRAVVSVGGFDTGRVGKVLGEDMEIIFRLHRWARKKRKKYRIISLPDPVCWTEVPESLDDLKKQRTRWQRASIETIWKHRGMMANPRYGLFGMFALPYVVLFEIFGPLVEISGYITAPIAWWIGIVDWQLPLLFLGVSVVYGTLLSMFSVMFEQITIRRYPAAGDLFILMVAGVWENLGFRQKLMFWRARALFDALSGKKAKHQPLHRKGFQKSESPAAG